MALELIVTKDTRKYHLCEVDASGTITFIYGSFNLADRDLDTRKFQRIRSYFGDLTVPNLISTNIDAENVEVDDLLYTDTYWEDLRVPGTATTFGAANSPTLAVWLTDGEGSPSRGVWLRWFSEAADEELFFTVQLPHSYKEGTAIEAHVHWVPEADGGLNEKVSWGLEYTWSSMAAIFGNTTIIYGDTTTPNDTGLLINKHYVTELGTIDGTGMTISSMLACRLFRDAAQAGGTDDYGDEAGLLEFDFHYQIDRPGSRQEYVK